MKEESKKIAIELKETLDKLNELISKGLECDNLFMMISKSSSEYELIQKVDIDKYPYINIHIMTGV